MNIVGRKICKIFPGKVALRNVDIDFSQAKINCVIGPNGAGKTTLFKVLTLLENPTSGELYFDGRPIVSLSREERLKLRRRIGFVMQNPFMFGTSVGDNVAYGLRVRREKEIEKKVDMVLEAVGLSNIKTQSALTLSSGEIQRVALARTIVLQPEVIFLDEPMANLDPLSRAIVEELILRMVKEWGVTVIMSTHDLRQAKKFGEKVFVLWEGRIIQQGTSDQVLSPEVSDSIGLLLG